MPIFVTEQPSSTLSSIRLEHARHINTGARKDMERCVFTQLLEKARWELPPSDHADWVLLLRETESNKNRMFNRSGYSPVQRMFGHLPRTVREVCSDFAIDPAVLDHAADLHKLLSARRAAEGLCRGEYGLCSQGGASQQGAHAETAQPRRGDLRLEVLEKPGVLKPCWVGPAIVPMPEGPKACINMPGRLWKVASEAVHEVCQDLKARIDRAQAKVIEDHTRDALPEGVVRAVPKGGGLEVEQEGALRGNPRPRPEEPETPVPARPLIPDAEPDTTSHKTLNLPLPSAEATTCNHGQCTTDFSKYRARKRVGNRPGKCRDFFLYYHRRASRDGFDRPSTSDQPLGFVTQGCNGIRLSQ